ncbi:HSP20 family molecular chaperone IbpA [Halospina denitrificans]|uniref:HSP20 family molecular chaperone IbpA n=1 Tax=Halospina denitrificans TaxID=332522 RepID=A0A4R7JXD3_9GAMM|nr:Hsp20/alpha crystallin family protein [Halospina denitrificans]TDT41729.1 HSP20 family molecular chaperone IbpA [Halospina denitrificans]
MEAKKQEPQKTEVSPRGSGGLKSLREEMNHVFDRFSNAQWPLFGGRRADDALSGSIGSFDPFASMGMPSLWGTDSELGRADLSETDEGYELQLDLPGMKKDDIQVDLTDGLLTVSGERSDEREDERKGYYFSERSYGSVRRSFRVPNSVKLEDVKAQFSDGVLTLTMPKTEEAQKNARKIEIE